MARKVYPLGLVQFPRCAAVSTISTSIRRFPRLRRGFKSRVWRQIWPARQNSRQVTETSRLATWRVDGRKDFFSAIIQVRLHNLGPVAQLDRALRYERRGRAFESLRARHLYRRIESIFCFRLRWVFCWLVCSWLASLAFIFPRGSQRPIASSTLQPPFDVKRVPAAELRDAALPSHRG